MYVIFIVINLYFKGTTMSIPVTGNILLDSILNKDGGTADNPSTTAWTNTPGTAITIHYNFEEGCSPQFIGMVWKALQAWANVANITYIEDTTTFQVDDHGRLISGTKSQLAILDNANLLSDAAGGAGGINAVNDAGIATSAEFIARPDYIFPFQIELYIHEIGHTLGFKHTGNYDAGNPNPDVPGPFLTGLTTPDGHSLDSAQYSIMSYNNDYNQQTPMIFDVLAAQYLYGANHSYNAGNTTYTLTSGQLQQTIWDGGGTDTLDSTGYSGNVTLDLREGYTCVTRVGTSQYWMAYGANIENATSGSGDDVIYGNALNNSISSGAGNDSVYLLNGSGSDTISSAGTSPTVSSSSGNDTVDTGTGNDSIWAGFAYQTAQHHDSDSFINPGGNDSIMIIYSLSSTYTFSLSGSATDSISLMGGSNNTLLFSYNNSSISASKAGEVTHIGDYTITTGAGETNYTYSISGSSNTFTNSGANFILNGNANRVNNQQGGYNITVDGSSNTIIGTNTGTSTGISTINIAAASLGTFINTNLDTVDITLTEAFSSTINLNGNQQCTVESATACGSNSIYGSGKGDTIRLTGDSNNINERQPFDGITDGSHNTTTINLNGSNNTIYTATGSNNVTVSGSGNSINDFGSSNSSGAIVASVTGPLNTLTGGSNGNVTATMTGSQEVADLRYTSASSNNTVSLVGSSSVIYTSTGHNNLTVTGDHDYINNALSSNTSGNITASITGDYDTLTGGSNGNVIATMTGSDDVADLRYTPGSHNSLALSGNNGTVYGSTGGDTISVTGSENMINESLSGSTANLTVMIGNASVSTHGNHIIEGSGYDSITLTNSDYNSITGATDGSRSSAETSVTLSGSDDNTIYLGSKWDGYVSGTGNGNTIYGSTRIDTVSVVGSDNKFDGNVPGAGSGSNWNMTLGNTSRTTGNNTVIESSGSDLITLIHNNDDLILGNNAITHLWMSGCDTNTIYLGSRGAATVSASGNGNTFYGGGQSDTITQYGSNNKIDERAAAAGTTITVNLHDGELNTILGGYGGDYITLTSSNGNDLSFAHSLNVTLSGSGNNNRIDVLSRAHLLNSLIGTDNIIDYIIDTATAPSTFTMSHEEITILADSVIVHLTGSDNTINGSGEDDHVVLTGDSSGNQIHANSGSMLVDTRATYFGGNTLFGDGADTLIGSNNVLDARDAAVLSDMYYESVRGSDNTVYIGTNQANTVDVSGDNNDIYSGGTDETLTITGNDNHYIASATWSILEAHHTITVEGNGNSIGEAYSNHGIITYSHSSDDITLEGRSTGNTINAGIGGTATIVDNSSGSNTLYGSDQTNHITVNTDNDLVDVTYGTSLLSPTMSTIMLKGSNNQVTSNFGNTDVVIDGDKNHIYKTGYSYSDGMVVEFGYHDSVHIIGGQENIIDGGFGCVSVTVDSGSSENMITLGYASGTSYTDDTGNPVSPELATHSTTLQNTVTDWGNNDVLVSGGSTALADIFNLGGVDGDNKTFEIDHFTRGDSVNILHDNDLTPIDITLDFYDTTGVGSPRSYDAGDSITVTLTHLDANANNWRVDLSYAGATSSTHSLSAMSVESHDITRIPVM